MPSENSFLIAHLCFAHQTEKCCFITIVGNQLVSGILLCLKWWEMGENTKKAGFCALVLLLDKINVFLLCNSRYILPECLHTHS